jgi:hypothetical protein
MGRLEQIVERNKHPRRHRKSAAGMTLGIGVAIFVFVILVLMVFTDLGVPPSETPATPAPAADDGTRRVRGIQLRSAPSPPAPRDAGAAADAR